MNSNYDRWLASAMIAVGSLFPSLGDAGQNNGMIQFSQSGHNYMIFGGNVVRDNYTIGTFQYGFISPLKGLPADKQELDNKIVEESNKDYQLYAQATGKISKTNSADTAASPFTIQMLGVNTGQILKDGKAVALIVPAPGSQTGETVVSAIGGHPSPEVMKFYEAYKRGDGISGSVAKASRGSDGNTPTVQFVNDPHFGNDQVVWRKGHIEIVRDGGKVADLGYTGGGYREGVAKRGIKIVSNEAIAGLTLGRKADVLSTGWEITTAKGTYNTAVFNGGSKSAAGITQSNPYGLEGEAVTATDIFRQQIDPAFTYPGLDKLRKDSGVSEFNSAVKGH